MADFPTSKSLNLTLTGSVQEVAVTYKADFYLLAHPDNTGNIDILAGDNDVKIWVLAPGDSFQVSSLTAILTSAIDGEIPLSVQGTADDELIGFLGT
jgi:hypothetical protein